MPRPFEYYFDRIAEALTEFGLNDLVAEGARPKAPLDERLIQCVWAEQMLLAGPYRSVAGREIEILEPGDWNHGPGPDFQNGVVIVDGETLKGDIELHLRSADFRNHKHDLDLEYNNVVLHVFLARTDDLATDTLHNGSRVERLELESILFPDLDSIRETISVAELQEHNQGSRGKCHPIFRDWDFEELRDFLNSAGRRRLEEKAERLASQAATVGIEQAFYQTMLAMMGVRGGRALYYLLAKRAPLDDLRDYTQSTPPHERADRLEAILFHVGGLLPNDKQRPKMDNAERERLAALERHWRDVEPYLADCRIEAGSRWTRGVRPPNFPTRRLAGIARWLAEWLERPNFLLAFLDDFRRAAPTVWNRKYALALTRELESWFLVEAPGAHWAARFSWGGKLAKSPMALIGESHARAILLNALLPALLLLARERADADTEAALFDYWSLFPKLPPNQISRRMRGRLFDERPDIDSLLNTEQRQQALLQVFHEFCRSNSTECSECVFFQRHNAGGSR